MGKAPDTPAAGTPGEGRQGGGAGRMTRSSRRTLILLGLVTLAPVVASYTAFYLLPRDKYANYGELLTTAPAPDVRGTVGDKPFALSDLRGKWVLVTAADGACDAACDKALYATRQARTIQGREMERIQRVWLVTGGTPSPARLAEHPDLVVASVPQGLTGFPAGGERIYLLDPLGNLVLAYPRDPDVKAMSKDMSRLLRASRIG